MAALVPKNEESPQLSTLKRPQKYTTIGSQFKSQLDELMSTLSATQSHYIRCMKVRIGEIFSLIFSSPTTTRHLTFGMTQSSGNSLGVLEF